MLRGRPDRESGAHLARLEAVTLGRSWDHLARVYRLARAGDLTGVGPLGPRERPPPAETGPSLPEWAVFAAGTAHSGSLLSSSEFCGPSRWGGPMGRADGPADGACCCGVT